MLRGERKNTPELDPFLNCLHKYTLNKTKQRGVFHQFSFDPYSLDTIVKGSWKLSTQGAEQCWGFMQSSPQYTVKTDFGKTSLYVQMGCQMRYD